MPQIKAKRDCPYWGALGGCELLSETICKTSVSCGFYPPTAIERAERVRRQRAEALREKRSKMEHPVITSMERTGSPQRETGILVCDTCGEEIGMEYYGECDGRLICIDCARQEWKELSEPEQLEKLGFNTGYNG